MTGFTVFRTCFTEFRTCFTEFRTQNDPQIDPQIDLPHASVLSLVQNTVSVIISCKTGIFGVVENTALSQMRSVSQEPACLA